MDIKTDTDIDLLSDCLLILLFLSSPDRDYQDKLEDEIIKRGLYNKPIGSKTH
jgi:hypothetical protein